VDVIATNITQTVGGSADVQSYAGNLGVAELTFGVTIQCFMSFCGPDCVSTCVGRNDSRGHFTCDELECMVCLPGYQNEMSNCTECEPRDGCCKCCT
jgi:hypothetical protein